MQVAVLWYKEVCVQSFFPKTSKKSMSLFKMSVEYKHVQQFLIIISSKNMWKGGEFALH